MLCKWDKSIGLVYYCTAANISALSDVRKIPAMSSRDSIVDDLIDPTS